MVVLFRLSVCGKRFVKNSLALSTRTRVSGRLKRYFIWQISSIMSSPDSLLFRKKKDILKRVRISVIYRKYLYTACVRIIGPASSASMVFQRGVRVNIYLSGNFGS